LSRVLGALVGVALAVWCGSPAWSALPPPVDGGTLGPLRLIMPVGEPQGLVFLFSDLAGPTAEFDRAAQRLAKAGAVVAPVDLGPFLARQDALPRDCLYLVADIEEASRRVQAQRGRGRYLTPIVAGTGMGAAVAYAALAQAPDATLDGAASDGFATRVATTKPLCAGAPFTPAAAGGFEYGPASLPGWWRVAPAAEETEAAGGFAAAAGAEDALVPPPIEGGLDERLAALVDPALVAPAENGVAGLPLVELPVAASGELMAVVYSGDGGWRDLDKEIAGWLQATGIPVVGVDSLRYFWSEKTPDQVAADLATILAHYRVAWRRPDVLLVGYSFGADVLPFAYNRLPEDERARVRRMALLGLAPTADFEIHVTGWLGVEAHAGSRPTAPELARIRPELVQCFYGAEEDDTACTLPELKGAELVRTAGGHHFDGDYGRLADAILAGVARR
jgi:type IV secretory pathway VirJ component